MLDCMLSRLYFIVHPKTRLIVRRTTFRFPHSLALMQAFLADSAKNCLELLYAGYKTCSATIVVWKHLKGKESKPWLRRKQKSKQNNLS